LQSRKTRIFSNSAVSAVSPTAKQTVSRENAREFPAIEDREEDYKEAES